MLYRSNARGPWIRSHRRGPRISERNAERGYCIGGRSRSWDFLPKGTSIQDWNRTNKVQGLQVTRIVSMSSTLVVRPLNATAPQDRTKDVAVQKLTTCGWKRAPTPPLHYRGWSFIFGCVKWRHLNVCYICCHPFWITLYWHPITDMPLYSQLIVALPGCSKESLVTMCRKHAKLILDNGGVVRGIENHGIRPLPARAKRFANKF